MRRGDVPLDGWTVVVGLLGGLAAGHAHVGPRSNGPPRFVANAMPPARIDMVKPRDSEAIDDNPDDVSIL